MGREGARNKFGLGRFGQLALWMGCGVVALIGFYPMDRQWLTTKPKKEIPWQTNTISRDKQTHFSS